MNKKLFFILFFFLYSGAPHVFANNLRTCLKGNAQVLCEHHRLTPEQAVQVEKSELAYNLKTCLKGNAQVLCQHHRLTAEQAERVRAAELGLPYQEPDPKKDDGAKSDELPKCSLNSVVWDHCYAKYQYEDGSKYEGGWLNNKRHGKGTLTTADGFIFMGQFKNGEPEGKGILRTPSGEEKKVVWRDGKFENDGVENPQSTSTPEDEYLRKLQDLQNDLQIRNFGSFLHTERVPNVLFLFDEIKEADSFQFRKAIRTKKIDLIVLSSPGGLVWEGLTIAGNIHDKKLSTYVPSASIYGESNCSSACSLMFCAGSERKVEGRLGVHQFYSVGKADKNVSGVQKKTQFTVSEIIGFLNEFETPPWVFERMFQQSEMYYFDKTEIAKLETTSSEQTLQNRAKANEFIELMSVSLKELLKE